MDTVRSCKTKGRVLLVALVVANATALRGQVDFAAASLAPEADRSDAMAQGIHRYFEAATRATIETRGRHWNPDTTSASAYEESVRPNRERFARMIGAVDAPVPAGQMEISSVVGGPAIVAETPRFVVHAVRWPVFDGVQGEGLLLEPKGDVRARVIALPDADQSPEMIAGLDPTAPSRTSYARRLAENGVQVLIPTLVDRTSTFSGSTVAGRWTNLSHREWIYRPAYSLGRHVIGYEVQKVRAAVEWLSRPSAGARLPIGVAGWGEGGLLALYSAGLDTRIDVALVSGYFGPRERLADEPIYRNVFGLLTEFGDAEIARLVLPRTLMVEPASAPQMDGPPVPREGQRNTAAPGRIPTPTLEEVDAEVKRARAAAGRWADSIHLVQTADALPFGDEALGQFVRTLTGATEGALLGSSDRVRDLRADFDVRARQERTVRELERHTQTLLRRASDVRAASFWAQHAARDPAAWRDAMQSPREIFAREVIGRLPDDGTPLNPRVRLWREMPAWNVYEVMLDVRHEVFAWGFLLVPKDLRAGERRPVVVAQHGLNSSAVDVFDEDPKSRFYHQFKGFGARLAERGFIVFAPRNPYRGDDLFRGIQRRANPLGQSIFSVIVAQHERILDWLGDLPFVDPKRIGFYGLSYGGKTAMRVPTILDRYAAVVCSGDFNEWIWKNATTESDRSYLFTNEYEMPEFNLGMTFSYAEMTAMIAPRPFMVERGHDDTVGLDEWVAFEYAKVRRLYDRLKISDRTEIEYFNGPHTIHGVGTFRFLHRHLDWPEPPR